MDFTAEWKSLWPISSTFSAPLLIQNNNLETSSNFGPLMFTSNHNSYITQLLHSPSLSPRLPPPYPNLYLSRFLQNYSSVPASAASLLGSQLPNYDSHFHGFNSLQLLQIPNKNLIIVFFPTGDNLDHVGFSLLSVKDGSLSVHSQRENSYHEVKEGNVSRQRITCLLVNPVDDFFYDENGDGMFGDVGSDAGKRDNLVVVVGYLMVCTNYSVDWYRVGITMAYKQNEFSVCVDYIGCGNTKMFRGNAVVSACWSPHLREECLVLLENGDLLLFDVSSSCGEKGKSMSLVSGNLRVVSKKMQVKLNDKLGLKEENGNDRRWFGCEFSWHPRIFIASHYNEVFLVDLRSSGDCNVCSLLKLEMLSIGKKDGFSALSSAGPDGFLFVVATRHLVLLCDVRKPLMPVLQWSHGLQHPQYLTVFSLSELRANAHDTTYKLASESGYVIILGSFWDSEFSLFCYGPDFNGNGSVSSEISKFCSSYYAWGLPSEISLSGYDCNCGSCLVKEEFLKASTPVWIDWRQKEPLVLGFGILGPSLSAQLSSADGFGGFILIRLTSPGKLEAEHYHAVCEPEKLSEAGRKRKNICLEDNLLYDCSNSEYDGKKKFQHLKFEFLNAYLKDKLAKHIVKRREKKKDNNKDARKRYLESKSIFHQEICQKLKAFGLPKVRSSLAVSDVLKDINLPTSIHEIALRSTCAALPTYLLQLDFSTYSDFKEENESHEEPLEFLDIPNQLQLPPFTFREPSQCSNKWSSKVRPSDALVGPILPPPFLTTLHKICIEEFKEERDPYFEETEQFSAHSQLKFHCAKVLEVVEKHVLGSDTNTHDDDVVNLADDNEYMSSLNKKPKFSYHKPLSFMESRSTMGTSKHGSMNDIFSTHVFRRREELASDPSAEMVGEELFDEGCPIELKFDKCDITCGPKELELFRHLKKQHLDFQRSFKPYQDFVARG